MKYLDLSFNYLKLLPKSIAKLRSLESLSINDNKFVILPNSIENLKSIKDLDFTTNSIAFIPQFILDLPYLEQIGITNEATIGEENKKRIKKLKERGVIINWRLKDTG